MSQLYPIKFTPIFKDRLWGGNKLKTLLNKDLNSDHVGESWEISDVKGDESVVNNGFLKNKTLKELIELYKGDLVGNKVYHKFGTNFPLLIKFIDAQTPLSVQVHPDDLLAQKKHNSFGKNEMWYIMEAEEDSELIIGFKHQVDKKTYSEHIKNGTISELLNTEKIVVGDTFYIPAGLVHAIGARTLLAEIQQTSDVTYRIHDYDRVDQKTGKKRELHNDLALDAIDFNVKDNYKTEYSENQNQTNQLVHCDFFTTNILPINQKITLDYRDTDSFIIYICVEGSVMVRSEKNSLSINMGETLMIPAVLNSIELQSDAGKIIEVTI